MGEVFVMHTYEIVMPDGEVRLYPTDNLDAEHAVVCKHKSSDHWDVWLLCTFYDEAYAEMRRLTRKHPNTQYRIVGTYR